MAAEWNPILLKELRPFLRQERSSWRMFWVAAFTLVGLAWCLALRAFAPGVFPGVGQLAFVILGFVQWFLSIMAVVPSATSIAVEREKHTYEGLVSSPLRPESLVQGKLAFAVYVATLTQLAVVPVLVGASLLGGVQIGQVPLYLVLLALHNCFLAAAGIYFSTLPHKPPKMAAGMLQASLSKVQIAQQKAMGLWALFVIPAVYGMIGVLSTPAAAPGRLPPAGATALELAERMKVLGGVLPAFSLTVREPATFFATRISFWIPALVFNGLMALLYYRLAVAAIRGRALDRGPGVRALCAALTHALLVLLLGNLWPPAPLDAPVAAYAFCGFATGWFLFVVGPALTMGEALPEDRTGRWAGVWQAFTRPAEALRHRTGTALSWLLGAGLPVLGYAAWLVAQAPGAAASIVVVEGGALFLSGLAGYGLFGLSCSIRRRTGESPPPWAGLLAVLLLAGMALPWMARTLVTGGAVPLVAQGPLQALGVLAGLINPFVAMSDVLDRALGGGPSALVADLSQMIGPLPAPLWLAAVAWHLALAAVGAWRLSGSWAEPPAAKEAVAEAA